MAVLPLEESLTEQQKLLRFNIFNSGGSGPDLRAAPPSVNCVTNYSQPQLVATSWLFLTGDPTREGVQGSHHV